MSPTLVLLGSMSKEVTTPVTMCLMPSKLDSPALPDASTTKIMSATRSPENSDNSTHQPELSMGPFCVTRYNPTTHQVTDSTQPNPLQVEKFGPNPTRPNTICHWQHYHFVTTYNRFPVPVRSAVKSKLTAWCNQILSNRALNAVT